MQMILWIHCYRNYNLRLPFSLSINMTTISTHDSKYRKIILDLNNKGIDSQ